MSDGTHNVYVVELDPAVLEDKRFRAENLECDEEKACFYVGMTGLTPEERFENHKADHKANKYVRDHGRYLRRRLYSKYNPMSYEDAVRMEVELAQKLRAKGRAVWQR